MTPAVQFREMSRSEYEAYMAWSYENYAGNLLRAGEASTPEAARETAKADLDWCLPQGRDTASTWFLVLCTAEGQPIGLLCWQAHRERPDLAFLFDLWIEVPYRNRGYGQAAMRRLFAEARARGFARCGLNVFRYNDAGIHTYLKCGMTVTETYEESLTMEISL